MKIKVINKSKHKLPECSTEASAGLDLRANCILNSPGTIDAEYRGEVYTILVNLSKENFVIEDGERICQKVISKHEKAEWENVDVLLDSERGTGGFGHTGNK
ncbi:MAG: dUTP diphosphatase [Bacteroidales bacterium]|jgi:dUTP pyrophosphatase